MISTWLYSAAFALMFSANSALVLFYGITKVPGHQVITAGVLVAPLIVLMGRFRSRPADYLFVAFVAVVAASVIVNGRTTTDREYALLAISLAAYPACRAVGNQFDHSCFVYITGAIVAAGTLVTAWALVHDQGLEYKPRILGFREGATVFSLSLCFLIFALLSINLSWRKWLMIGVLMAVPSIVFAAAMVRHPFIALCLTLSALAIFAGSRRQVLAFVGVICLSIFVGLASRPGMSNKIIALVVQNAQNGQVSCDSEDTAGIRVVLAREAIAMIPGAGFVGSGIGKFAQQSCYKADPHNTVLQTAAELGVAAALILIALFCSALIGIAGRVRFDPVARFVFAGLVFAGLESLVAGSLTNSTLLFGLMGWAVGLQQMTDDRHPAAAKQLASKPMID